MRKWLSSTVMLVFLAIPLICNADDSNAGTKQIQHKHQTAVENTEVNQEEKKVIHFDPVYIESILEVEDHFGSFEAS